MFDAAGHDLREREADLAVLRAALGCAQTGQGAVVVVGGEAGIGKTSLIRAFLAEVPSRVRVLAGGCDDLLAPRALAPLREAARRRAGPLAAALATADADIAEATVAELRSGPAVLVVDDVHWADDATLDVLCHVARRIAQLPALLLVGVRKEALTPDHPAQALLGGLAGAPTAYVDLAPLSVAAVAMLAGQLDGVALHRITGGNPFFVTEVLAAPQEELPGTITEAVLSRIARLPAETITALERLSVLPDVLDPALKGALLGNEVTTLVAAEERGVIEVRDGGIAFRHELARRAVAAALPALRRRQLHADVVAALRSLGTDDAERLVHHAVAAGDVAAVLEFAPGAAREAAARGSHRQALAHLEAAATHAEALTAVARTDLWDDLAWELYIAQRFVEAVAAGRRSLALCRSIGRRHREAALSVRLGRYLLMAGEIDEAGQLHDRAAALLGDDATDAELAEVHLHRATLMVQTDRLTEAAPLLRSARRLAEQAARQDLWVLAQAYAGMIRAHAGETAAGEADVREALQIALVHGHTEAAARIYTNLVDMLFILDDAPALAETVTRAQRFCVDRGLVQFTVLIDLQQQILRMRTGQFDAAARGLRELAARARPAAFFAPRVDAWAGRLMARQGNRGAGEVIRAAWQEALRQRHPIVRVHAATALAEWAWLNHDPVTAHEVADAALPQLERSPAWAVPRGELLRLLVRCGIPAEPFDGCPPRYAAGLRGDWRTAAELSRDPYEKAVELGLSGIPAAMARGWEALDAMGATAAARLVRRALAERGASRLLRTRQAARRTSALGLTDRQFDVLEQVARGATNAEIARHLELSVRTVDAHVAGILARLQVRTRHEAAARLRDAVADQDS